ncbi:Wadjet anti-phage system protein JetD domain-containing protein [Roseburia sp. MSJ-14]|uniref:Wadjet anti-phage system protein JetD domain-containing protein n=1 Tax=Roseburia sp. MSJ-14 TaxID=2841514 RepID=UPI001C1134C0|nr:Wadjet anti-phage system protein JetD domain-containing protein [Roseburia sp. MSJ-14]MBU5472570.1 DUF2220 domain-containing protein [Roseburia sp. MSJ-14]
MVIENPVLKEMLQIIEKNDNWREEKTGNKSFKDIQKIYGKHNEQKELCNKILKEWQEKGYVNVDWHTYPKEVGRKGFQFSLKKKNFFYEMAGVVPKEQRIAKYTEWVRGRMSEASKGWTFNYYKKILENLESGKISTDLEKDYEPIYQTENKELFQCIDELNRLDVLTYKRVFSKKVFNNSKKFEKQYEKKIISKAKEWGEEGFFQETHNKDILRLMNLDDYSTNLSVKGTLRIRLNGKEIDYGAFIFGCDITTKTLEEMEILNEQDIEKVITVENKANFVSMPMEEKTLIIFTHGYMSPLECRVLQSLESVLGEKTKYYHTGDLDLGGIQIFRFIKKNVFSKLEPLNMNGTIYKQYVQYGEKPDVKNQNDYWMKLEKERSEPFEKLVDAILEKKLVIEQEAFLIR